MKGHFPRFHLFNKHLWEIYYELGTLNVFLVPEGCSGNIDEWMNEWMTLPQMLLLDATAEATEKERPVCPFNPAHSKSERLLLSPRAAEPLA